MATTWIIAADESRARVLQVGRPNEKLIEIDNMVNPTARQHERDLRSDSEPRFDGHGGVGKPGMAPTGGTASDRETQGAIDHSVTVFARDVARYLAKARIDRRYDKLVLVAPPKFLGALRKQLDKDVARMVVEEIPKEVSGLKTHDLTAYFRRQ